MEKLEFSVDVTKSELENLNICTQNIETLINEIQNLYNSLDDTIWLSKEKKQLDEYLISYLDDCKKQHLSKLNNFNESLRIYTEGYQNLITKISRSVNNG